MNRRVVLGTFALLIGAPACGQESTQKLPEPDRIQEPNPEVSKKALENDGWDDEPGSGRIFIVTEFSFADRPVGFDLDNDCAAPGDCVDNVFGEMGYIWNDQIRQEILGGERLILVELSGLDDFRNDPALTVKVYGAFDFDDPVFPANNLRIPDGHVTCCQFFGNETSLDRFSGQAVSRFRGVLEEGRLRVLDGSADIDTREWTKASQCPEDTFNLAPSIAEVRWDLLLAEDGRSVEGLLGGVTTLSALSRADNPYCKTLNQLCPRQLPDSSMLDLIGGIFSPDVDVDGDGLEAVEIGVRGRVEQCFDGDGSLIPPLDSAEPWSCAFSDRLSDGFSLAIELKAVPAVLVGFREPPAPDPNAH